MEIKNTTEHEFSWLTTGEVAIRQGCSGDNIQKKLRAKKMPHVKVGAPGPGRSLFLIHVNDMQRTQACPLVEDSDETENRSGREFPWRSTVWAGKTKGLPGRTMQEVLNRGEIPYVKIGSPGKGRALFLIHLQDLEDWWPKWAESQSPMAGSRKPGREKPQCPPDRSGPDASQSGQPLLGSATPYLEDLTHSNPLSEEVEYVEGEFVDIP